MIGCSEVMFTFSERMSNSSIFAKIFDFVGGRENAVDVREREGELGGLRREMTEGSLDSFIA